MDRPFLVSLLHCCLLFLCRGMLFVTYSSCIADADYAPHPIHFLLRPKYEPTSRILRKLGAYATFRVEASVLLKQVASLLVERPRLQCLVQRDGPLLGDGTRHTICSRF